jgi:CRP-like cAMP-binding protein
MITSIETLPGIEFFGDATPFVARIHEIIETITLFDDFEMQEIEILARYMRFYRAPPGTEVIREGDDGDFMLLLLDGHAEVVRKDARGLPQILATVGPGKTLGEMSLIDGKPRFSSCVALEPLQFAVLDRASFSRFVTEEPHLGVKLLMELLMLLNQRLRSVSTQLIECHEARRLRIR